VIDEYTRNNYLFRNSETPSYPRLTTLQALIIACLDLSISIPIAKNERYRSDAWQSTAPLKLIAALFLFCSLFFPLKLPLRNGSSDIRASNQTERVISAGRAIPIYRPTNHTSTLAAITVE